MGINSAFKGLMLNHYIRCSLVNVTSCPG